MPIGNGRKYVALWELYNTYFTKIIMVTSQDRYTYICMQAVTLQYLSCSLPAYAIAVNDTCFHLLVPPFSQYSSTNAFLFDISTWFMPVGKGGSRGFLEPPFWPTKKFIHHPSLCKWSTCSTSTERYHCPSKFVCNYVLCLFIEDQQMNAERVQKCFTLKGRV